MDFIDAKSTELLLRMTAKINSVTDTNELLQEIMDSARAIMKAEASSLILHDKHERELVIKIPTGMASKEISGMRIKDTEGIAGWVVKNQKPIIINDALTDKRIVGDLTEQGFQTKNLICIPLRIGSGDILGVLEVINKQDSLPFMTEDLTILQALGHQAAIALQRQTLFDEAIDKERKIRENELRIKEEQHNQEQQAAVAFTKGVENERKRVAMELHDHILGMMSSTMRELQQCKLLADNSNLTTMSESILEQLDTIGSEIRVIMDDLKPAALEHFGLDEALELFCEKTTDNANYPIKFDIKTHFYSLPLSDYQIITLYRICQESIQNAVKHGKATQITIELIKNNDNDADTAILSIHDNGCGFNTAELNGAIEQRIHQGGGHGLINIRHRMSTINGSIRWESDSKRGTTVTLLFPL